MSAQFLFKQKNIWIKSPQMSLQEFKASVQALGPSHISYAQNKLSKTREQIKAFQLKKKLVLAQEFYLSGEEAKAIKAFKQITDLALSADWDEEERRIILYSFLRQAQIEKDLEKRKALLLSTSNFTVFEINSTNYPDYELFPPPLMEELKLIQRKVNFLSMNWKNIFPDHQIILINGIQIKKNEKLKIPQSFYRISAFSSSHLSWSKKLNLSELLSQKIKTDRLTKGSCENLQIKADWKNKNTQILNPSPCPTSIISHLKTNSSYGKNPSAKKFETKSDSPNKIKNTESSHSLASLAYQTANSRLEADLFSPSDSSLLNSDDLSNNFEDPDSKNQHWLSNVPPWLIVGAGALTVILIISMNQEQGSPATGIYTY